MKSWKLILGVIFIASLAACGGGGSGSASAPVAVTGTASKGLLKAADVQAYEVSGGKLVKYGLAVKTGTDGSYSLSLTPTNNPVVIEVTTNSDTKMLDETTVVNGKFAEVAAPTGLSLRTMVDELTVAKVAEANPYTEMAIAGAIAAQDASGNAVPLSKEVLLASKEVVKEQLRGLNPFAIKAVDADAASPSDDQKKLMTLLTGVAKAAKDDNACDLKCQITAMNTAAAIKYDATSGKGIFKDTAAAATKVTALANKAALVSNPMIVALPTYSAVSEADIASATEIVARDSFESFVAVMREGLQTVDKTFNEATTAINTRIKDLTFNTAKAGLDAFNAAASSCRFTDSKLVCTGDDVTANADGSYSLSYTSSSYKNVAQATGSFSNGVATVSIKNANSTALSNNKKYAEMSLSASISGIDSTTGEISLDSGVAKLSISVTGYDDAAVEPVTLSLKDLTVSLSEAGKKMTLNGGLSISNAEAKGDKLDGTLKLAFTKMGASESTMDMYPESIDLALKGYGANKKLFDLAVMGSADYKAYKPWLADSSSNEPIGSVNLVVGFVEDKVQLDVSTSKTGYQKGTMKVKFSSGGNYINADAILIEDSTGKTVPNSDGINIVSSSGDFSANIKKTDGKFQGTIKQGSVTAGTIDDGLVKVGGKELSLK